MADGILKRKEEQKDHLRLGRRGTECDGGGEVEVGGNGWSRLLGPAPRTPQLSQTRLSSLVRDDQQGKALSL